MYKIYGDSCCDLPLSYATERNINLVPLSYTVDGTEYSDDGKNVDNIKLLYDKMREGKLTNTSQPTQDELYSIFEASAEKNEELIYMTLSSGISATYNSACLMLNKCLEVYPDAKISVIDSLCASGGYGLLMQRIADNRDNGMPYEEAVEWIKGSIETDFKEVFFYREKTVPDCETYFSVIFQDYILMFSVQEQSMLFIDHVKTSESPLYTELKNIY